MSFSISQSPEQSGQIVGSSRVLAKSAFQRAVNFTAHQIYDNPFDTAFHVLTFGWAAIPMFGASYVAEKIYSPENQFIKAIKIPSNSQRLKKMQSILKKAPWLCTDNEKSSAIIKAAIDHGKKKPLQNLEELGFNFSRGYKSTSWAMYASKKPQLFSYLTGPISFTEHLRNDNVTLDPLSDETNYFETVPIEILQEIFEYTPESFGSLKKVSKRTAAITDKICTNWLSTIGTEIPLLDQKHKIGRNINTFSATAKYLKLSKILHKEVLTLRKSVYGFPLDRNTPSPLMTETKYKKRAWKPISLLLINDQLSDSALLKWFWKEKKNHNLTLYNALQASQNPKFIIKIASLDLTNRIPNHIFAFRNIETLTLNTINLDPIQWDNFINLKELHIKNCYTSNALIKLSNIQTLRRLCIIDPCDDLKDTIGKISQIEHLRLQGREIEYLPKSIGKLQKLTSLEIKSCNIRFLPSSIKKITDLDFLDIVDCPIETLPRSLADLNIEFVKFRELYKLNLDSIDKKVKKKFPEVYEHYRDEFFVHPEEPLFYNPYHHPNEDKDCFYIPDLDD